MIGVLAASLGLAACGRKGPLDPPPSASLEGDAKSAPSPAQNTPSLLNPIAVQPLGGRSSGSDQMETPPGPKKSFFLDGLLN
jgi:predicted small lipoprotein YifL